MSKICDLGIKQLIRDKVGTKPWYKYNENKDDSFIEVVNSPNGKVNTDTFIGVARSTAKALNSAINIKVNIGSVFYETLDYGGKVGVIIAPTDHQLKLLNANEDAERATIMAEEEESQYNHDVEYQIIEDKIRNGEIKQICEL